LASATGVVELAPAGVFTAGVANEFDDGCAGWLNEEALSVGWPKVVAVLFGSAPNGLLECVFDGCEIGLLGADAVPKEGVEPTPKPLAVSWPKGELDVCVGWPNVVVVVVVD
jgi:hypothetical protein